MTEADTSDDDLMLAYAAGDQASFARLYERYRGRAYRYFNRQLDAAEADDCFQTLWLKIIRQACRYQAAGVFDRYLFTLAHNVLMDHLRKRGRRPELAETLQDDSALTADGTAGHASPAPVAEGGPETYLAGEELRQCLLVLLEGLPFQQREAWVLKQESGLTVADIATITGTSTEGVRSRLRYATSKLKAGLSRHV